MKTHQNIGFDSIKYYSSRIMLIQTSFRHGLQYYELIKYIVKNKALNKAFCLNRQIPIE